MNTTRNEVFDELTQIFRNKASNAKLKAREFDLKIKDPKYGENKRQNFRDQQKHFNRLAQAYNRSARDIIWLRGTVKGQVND